MPHSAELTFEPVAGPFTVTEGPAWDGAGLIFTDINANVLRRYDPATGDAPVVRSDTGRASGLMFDQAGRLFGCDQAHRRVVRYDEGGRVTVVADRLDGRRLNSPNDLAVDSQGRIWFSDPRYTDRSDMELPFEEVLRATPTGPDSWRVERITHDVNRPNGLLLSADERTLYVAEHSQQPDEPRELRAYDVRADGSVGAYQVLHDFGAHRAIDGMCLDVEGNIVATAGHDLGGPGRLIYVFAPSGRVLATHPLPPQLGRPTNCTFGGPDLTDLYVTGSSGCLHRARTTHRGRLWWPTG